MPPTAKDLDVVATASSQSPVAPSGAGGKAQPVALEVPVTVNGACTVGGSDKREPFSETTQTVLVFGNGAVIRLASTVTPGQLLFLTNEKTKKEVVCQVLKSKTYSNVSGYVELEFTEPMAGFWGVRFAGDAAPRAIAPPAAPVAAKPAVASTAVTTPPSPIAPKTQPPAQASLPKPPESLPLPTPPTAKTETITTSAAKPEVRPSGNAPSAERMAMPALPKPPALPSSWGGGATSSSRAPDRKPPAPAAPKAPSAPTSAPHASTQQMQASSEALKRESARLQEQLSAMLFNPQGTGTAPPSGASKPATGDPAAKIIEMAKPQPPAARVAPPGKSAVQGLGSSLDAGEVKIPSWLEPLARNAATPAHNEVAAREQAPHPEEVIEFEVQDVSAPATAKEIALVEPTEPPLDVLATSEISARPQHYGSAKNNKMILIGGIAAGLLLLVAGGTWYARHSSSSPAQAVTASTLPAAAPGATATPPIGKTAADASASSAGNFPSAATNSSPAVSTQSSTPAAQPLRAASDKNAVAELSAYKRLAEPQPQPALQPQPKKSSLGEVRLAAPAVTRRPTTAESGPAELAPALSATQVAPGGDALGGALVVAGVKQPSAPSAPPVGGDVKQAKLLSSIQPIYPVLAKTQHIEGNVRIDALVDENGRVSSAKVVSGPTLLHQAALDALRQWKYQPATLDGKAVPMHLTVTLQFRLQ
jgi:protein TonB